MKDKILELIDIMSDIKICSKTGDFTRINSLIEKWQVLGNRIEAGLMDKHDFAAAQQKYKSLKKKIKKMEKEIEDKEDEL